MEIGDITAGVGFVINQADLTAKLRQAERLAVLPPVPLNFDVKLPTVSLQTFEAQHKAITAQAQAQVAGLLVEWQTLGQAIGAAGAAGAGNSGRRSSAMNTEAQTARILKQEVNALRNSWQAERVSEAETVNQMTRFNQQANVSLDVMEMQIAALRAKGTLNAVEQKQLADLIALQNSYSIALKTTASTINTVNGVITRGSLAAGVRAGMNDLAAAIRGASAETERLINAQKAGLITNQQMLAGINGQTVAHRAALTAIETEAVALRGLGVLDAAQTLRLEQLVVAQNGYTAALARTVVMQEQSAAAQRAAAGAALGVRGGAGMSGAAIGLSFVDPTLGMIAFAASMGPVIAGLAAIGLGMKAFGDGIDKAAVFQRSLTQIGALTHQSAAEMNQYGAYVQQLSTQLPLTTQQLLELGRQAVLVGLHGSEGIKMYTENMAALSIVLRDVNGHSADTAAVGQEVVKVLRSMGASSEGVNQQFAGALNSLVALKTQFGAQVPEITNLAKFWSSYGHEIGLTTDQVFGWSAALVSVGARAQGAGGSLQKFFQKLASDASEGSAGMGKWAEVMHMSADEALNLVKTDPSAFLKKFVESLPNFMRDGKDSTSVLKEFGLTSNQVTRAFSELGTSTKNVDQALRAAKEGISDSGLALRTAMAATRDYKDQQVLLGNAFTAFKTNIGQGITPAMSALLGWMLDMSKAALNLSQYMNGTLGAGDIQVGKLSPADQADVQLTLKAIDSLKDRSDAAGKTLLAQAKAHLDVLRQMAAGTWVGPTPWAKSGASGVGIGPLSPGQQRVEGTSPYAQAGNEIGHQLAAYAVAGIHGATTSVANECSVFVRQVFQQAFPKAGRDLFGATANATRDNFSKAGLLNTFNGDRSTLKEGQVVFNKNDPSGDGHVGVVVIVGGQKYVAENSSVAAAKSPTGDARSLTPIANFGAITDVGDVNGYKRIPGFVPGATPAAGGSKAAADKPFEAYIKEAQRLQTAIENAQKANKPEAWRTATAQLEDFKKSNDDAAAAVEWLTASQKKAKDIGVTDADLKRFGAAAQRLALEQEAAAKSTDPGALKKADNDLANWVAANGQAAEKVQQYYASALAKRRSNESQADAESKRISQALAQNRVTDAQTALERLRTIQAQELQNAGDSQAQRLAVVKRTSQQIYNAEMALARVTRRDAISTAQDEKNPTLRAAKISAAESNYALADQKAKLERIQAVASAQKSADSEADAAAKLAHDKRDASNKAIAALQARLNEELRQGTIQKAQDTLTALGQLRERDLADAKTSVVEKLRLTRLYAQMEYDAAVKVAEATRQAAIRAAENAHTRNGNPLDDRAQQVAIDAANRAYGNTLRGADNTRAAAITGATQAQTSAIQAQRDSYHQLADSLRAAITQGTFDETQRQAALVSFNALGREADKLGLTHERNTELSRQSTYALIQEASGTDKATAAYEAYWKAREGQNNEGMADAGMRGSYGVGQEGLTAALVGSGANRKLLGDPQAALADLDKFNHEAADRIRRVYEDELSDFQNYHDNLNASILETTTAAYAQIKQGMADDQAAADEANTTVESLTTMLQGVLANGLDPQTSGYLQLLDEIIAKGGQAGVAAQQVKDNLDDLLNTAAAPSLLDVLGNPDAYGDGARDMPSNGPGPSVTAALQKQIDSGNADRLRGLSDAQLKVAESEAIAGDQGEQLSLIFAEQKRRTDEATASASKLAAIQSQQAHSTLEYQHSIKALTDAQYFDQKAMLDRTDAWQKWQDVVKANGDVKTATAQLWADLLKIDQEGIQARRTMYEDSGPVLPEKEKTWMDNQTSRQVQIQASAFADLSDEVLAADRATAELSHNTEDYNAILAEQARRLQQTGGQYGKLVTVLDKVSQGMDIASGLFSRFSGGEATAAGAAFDWIGMNVKAASQALSGDWMGAIATTINGIGDFAEKLFGLSDAVKANRKELLALADLETSSAGGKKVGLLTNPYYDALQEDAEKRQTLAKAGFWQRLGWNLFGGAPEVLSSEAAKLKSAAAEIFGDLGSSISGNLSSSLMNAFNTADWSGSREMFEKSFNQMLAQMYINATIKASGLETAIQAYADAKAAGRDGAAELANLRSIASGVFNTAQAGISALPGYGADAAIGTTGGNTMVSGAAPTAQFGIPEIQFPAVFTAALTNIGNMDIPLFNRASQRLYDGGSLILQAAQLIIDGSGSRQTTRSNLGSLT